VTFDATETSISGGQPIELFDFLRRATHWRYAGGDRDQVLEGANYACGQWSTGGYTASGDPSQETLTVTAPLNAAVAEQFRVLSPSDPVYLRVLHIHAGETDPEVWWTGQITGVSRKPDHLEITGESIVTAQQALGLWLAWQKACPYSTYDADCGLDAELFAFAATVMGTTGSTVTAAEFADTGLVPAGRLAGGFLLWDVGGGFMERRAIAAHDGDTITMLNSSFGIAVGMSVLAHPACDQSAQVCHDEFDNLDNFGGVPGLPDVSPFDQSPFI
jgi:uncharacterized phage protein (TIGR02218 family)